jgi:hypothetical protein
MSEFSDFQSNLVAAGSVVGATGALNGGAGFLPARTGAGVYTITLSEDVPEAEAVVTITPKTAAISLTVAHTSNTVKTVSALDTATGAVPTDCDFEVKIERILTGH